MKSVMPLLLAAVPALGCATASTATTTTATATTTTVPAPVSPPGDLVLGQPVERALASGQRHEYQLELGAEQFLHAVADQRGVDVAIKVYGPEGEVLAQFDSLHGPRGPEPVSLFTERAGVHRIAIEATGEAEPNAGPGRYALTLARVEAAASDPAGRVGQLMSYWDRTDGPGAAIAVVVDDALALSGGWGRANLEYDVPIEPTTIFQVASVSKQFTAFAVMMLAQQGELSLEDDVRKYVSEVPDLGATITLRNLLNHTSGLRDQWSLLSLAGIRMDEVITQRDILTLVHKQRALDFAPGTEFSYSNTNYTLLAEVVHRVTGQTLRQWCAEHLFAPLGMERSQFRDDHESIVPGRAYSYSIRPDGAGYYVHGLNHANVGATGLYTTVQDLARWAINLDTGAVGGAAVTAEIQERAVLAGGAAIDYASGLYHGQHRGLRFVGHGGSDAGFRATLLRFPDYRFAVAVTSNDGEFPASGIAHKIAEIYLAAHMSRDGDAGAGAGAESGAKSDAKPDAEAGAKPQPKPDDASMAAYVGTFRLENGMEVAIRREGERLMIRPAGMPDLELVPQAQTTFLIREFSATLTFERDGSGPVSRLTLRQGGMVIPGERVQSYAPTAAELAQYAGRYFCPELETFYTVSVRDGALVATHWRNGEIPLTAVEADRFSGDKWYFDRVAFTREGKAITGMEVSNGRMRKVRFERVRDGDAKGRAAK